MLLFYRKSKLMLKIDYTNVTKNQSKFIFTIKYILNYFRTWYYFHFKFPWVKYKGFVRIMSGTSFAKRKIILGNKVQFGKNVKVATDIIIGNHVLIAGNVDFVGKKDHCYEHPGVTMWNSPRGKDNITEIGNDVWIGNKCTIISGVKIGNGSIVSAGSVVTKNIPPCEIWGGVPAKKIKDRFTNQSEKQIHLNFLSKSFQ